MNDYPSWIARIPDMLERLALAGDERIDRLAAERLFDLRRSAARELLRRMGAGFAGHSLVIGRGLLMARLREAQENPGWKWEAERRRTVAERIEALRPRGRPAVVPVSAALREKLEGMRVASLPPTIQLAPGRVTIHCRDLPDLLEQLVQLAQAVDHDTQAIETCGAVPRRPAGSAESPLPVPAQKA